MTARSLVALAVTLVCGTASAQSIILQLPSSAKTAPVSLVAYAEKTGITVQRATPAADGTVKFDKVDVTGTTAYYALAQRPDTKGATRATSGPITRSSAEPIQMYEETSGKRASSGAAGTVSVQLIGKVQPTGAVEIVDVASKKVVGSAKPAAVARPIKVSSSAGRIVYARTTISGKEYTSRPTIIVADRGATLELLARTRIVAGYDLEIAADDAGVEVRAVVSVVNTAWTPYASSVSVPLPRGAKNARIEDDLQSFATLTNEHLTLPGPLPPMASDVVVTFDVPASPSNSVLWSQELPYDTVRSTLVVVDEPGLTLEPPAGTTAKLERRPTALAGTHLVEFPNILPGSTLTFRIGIPKPSAANALARACHRLRPEALEILGKPLAFKLPHVGTNKMLDSKSLRGKPLLVNMMGSWGTISRQELPTLVALAKANPKVAIVLLASDEKVADVEPIARSVPFPVLLDKPTASATSPIGATTRSWGITLLPETILVDKRGIARLYFRDKRDWSSPAAARCLGALAK